MTSTPTPKKKISEYTFEDLKTFFLDLTKQISSKVILVEIGNGFFNIALAKSQNNNLEIKKVFRQDLPPEAIEKSIPSDPAAFANILQEIIKEQKFFSKRVAISLSSDACYTRLVEIPNQIKEQDVINFLGNPKSGIQIPISLNNSDFDIKKTTLPQIIKNGITHDRYFLTSIPKKSVSLILEIINKSNLELCSLQMSHMCVGNTFKSEIERLDANNLIISVDLLDEFTQLTIFDKNGPIFIKRLGAIRKYPTIEEMKLIKNKTKDENSSPEDYHLLSTLDLKVLIREIRDSFKKFSDTNELNKNGKIFLSGRNCQHKNLVPLLGESLNMDVALISPLGNYKLKDFSYDPDLINQFSMSRIIGLGLSLMNDKSDDTRYQKSNELLIESFKSKKIKSKKKEISESKKVEAKKEELPPLPDLGIKSKKEISESKKINGEKNNFKKNGENFTNQEKNEFKMDTSFLDID